MCAPAPHPCDVQGISANHPPAGTQTQALSARRRRPLQSGMAMTSAFQMQSTRFAIMRMRSTLNVLRPGCVSTYRPESLAFSALTFFRIRFGRSLPALLPALVILSLNYVMTWSRIT
jgi:hypothetical protein